jgi:hypothetical protein
MNKQLLLTSLIAGAMTLGSQLHAQNSEPFVTITATDPMALEGTSTGAFTLIRNGDTSSALTVDLGIGGSASNGVDYAQITNEVTIPAGYLAIDIAVTPIVDTTDRGNKTVVLTIKTNADYQVGGERRATVTIIDDVFNTPVPTVSLVEPTNGSTFEFPAGITLTADAGDSGGATITSVSFFVDDDLLGRVTNAPYTLVWTNGHGGRHMLFARAVDNLGQSALSTPIEVTITDILPAVQITSPTNGQNFSAHQDIPIAATVTDADSAATIARVTFYANGRSLGSVTNTPYQIAWSNAPAGFYTLQAAATDNVGQKAYSKGVQINVSRQAE